MEELKGKVAVVTGASSGIGAAVTRALVEAGMTVVGLARRKEKIEELAAELEEAEGKLHALRVDVTVEDEILHAFDKIRDNLGAVHVLINNAGVMSATDLIDGDTKKWKTVFDINVMALTIATREAIKSMRDNEIDGHIVNINSIVGHKVSEGFNVYPASKYAVTAITETFRLELIRAGSKIKITSLSPGIVATNLFDGADLGLEAAQEAFKVENPLTPTDIVNAIKYIITTPPHVQISELTIRPVDQTF